MLNGKPTDVSPSGAAARESVFLQSYRAELAHFIAVRVQEVLGTRAHVARVVVAEDAGVPTLWMAIVAETVASMIVVANALSLLRED